jgi:ribosomal protein S18 acetylase RimI-like enzyme
MKQIVTRLCECPAKDYVPLRDTYAGGVAVSMWKHKELVYVFRLYKHKTHNHELADVWIHPNYRSKLYSKTMKYSTKLMRTAMRIIKDHKMKNVWLWTLQDNHRAIALYTKFGFVLVKVHKKRNDAIRKLHTWIKHSQTIVQMNLKI